VDQHTLERILDLSSRMAETRALKPLLEYAMDEAMKLVGAERGYIVLLTEGGTLDFRVMRSADATPMDDGQDQISTTILDKVIITGQPIIVEDASTDSELGRAKSVALLKLRSVMCVPLIARGEVIGAIYVENRTIPGRFSEGDQFPLTIFANQAAVAIENAALNAVDHLLPAGSQTVGTGMTFKHTAPTPLGATVRARAELTEVDGRRLVFRCEAFDPWESIGTADHERFVVQQDRFLARVAEKAKRPPAG